MRWFLTFVLMLAFVSPAVAKDDHDPLSLLVSRSDLVVVATIASPPKKGLLEDNGVAHYTCGISISEFLKGQLPKRDGLQVRIVRLEWAPGDKLPLPTRGTKCILFLKKIGEGDFPLCETVDLWFGVQPYRPTMAFVVKELAKKKAS